MITANEPVWIQVKDGATTLKPGELAAGQSYEVPATATAPVLTTGKPEALRISVGTADAPPVGPAATTVRDVSLLGPDLMRGPQRRPRRASAASSRDAARLPPRRPRRPLRPPFRTPPAKRIHRRESWRLGRVAQLIEPGEIMTATRSA